MFKLPELSFKKNDLEPYISSETIDFHYGKHHQTYVDNLNKLIKKTVFETSSLESIVKESTGVIFNNAAQVWNHNFYWNCLDVSVGALPQGLLLEKIERSFGSFNEFKDHFTKVALQTFGSGWIWLVYNLDSKKISVVSTANAECPLTTNNLVPLMTCDVWEHAYYIDYRNARPKYVENFWYVVKWSFVAKQLERVS